MISSNCRLVMVFRVKCDVSHFILMSDEGQSLTPEISTLPLDMKEFLSVEGAGPLYSMGKRGICLGPSVSIQGKKKDLF